LIRSLIRSGLLCNKGQYYSQDTRAQRADPGAIKLN